MRERDKHQRNESRIEEKKREKASITGTMQVREEKSERVLVECSRTKK